MFGLPKGVTLLIVNTLFSYIGFFAFIPFLSIYLIDHLGWSPAMAGVLLMVRQVAQQGPPFFTGMLADRLGLKTILILGLLVRGTGFILFAFAETPLALFATAALAGFGGALFGPTGSGMLAHLTPEDQRARVFSLQKAVGNVGTVLSTGLGALLIQMDFALLSYVSGGIFLFMGLISYLGLPKVESKMERLPYRQMGEVVLKDKVFLFFVGITSGVWFLYMQLYLTLPLQLFQLTGEKSSIALLNLVMASSVILLQYPLLRYLNNRWPAVNNLAIGAFLLGCGTVIMGFSPAMAPFMAGLVVFSCGVIIVEPMQFDLTARMADEQLMATYFGFSSLAVALGGGISQGLGGWLFQQGPVVMWGSCGLVCLMVLIGLSLLQRTEGMQELAGVKPK